MEDCCQPKPNYKKGLWSGLLYGLIPHTFCLIFLILSIIGAVGANTLIKKFLVIPHFFSFLVGISFLFATISATFYLKKINCCTLAKIKNKWKYLFILYSSTIITNILIIFVIFPLVTNLQLGYNKNQENNLLVADINVEIPCTGHAPLIIDEIKKETGVGTVKFKIPNTFEISYNPQKTSLEKIDSLEIFKTFKVQTNNLIN